MNKLIKWQFKLNKNNSLLFVSYLFAAISRQLRLKSERAKRGKMIDLAVNEIKMIDLKYLSTFLQWLCLMKVLVKTTSWNVTKLTTKKGYYILSNTIHMAYLHTWSNVQQDKFQGSTNCAHGDERARNVHAKRFLGHEITCT